MNEAMQRRLANADRSNRATLDRFFQGIDHSGSFIEMYRFKELPDGEYLEVFSRDWLSKLLNDDANPYNPRISVKRSVHVATADSWDVLRHQYIALDLPLVLLETSENVELIIDRPVGELLGGSPSARMARINELARQLLATDGIHLAMDNQRRPYRWVFSVPQGIEVQEGVRFSTNPLAELSDMWSWTMRADGGIRNERLYFLMTKRDEQTSGRLYRISESGWFSGKYHQP